MLTYTDAYNYARHGLTCLNSKNAADAARTLSPFRHLLEKIDQITNDPQLLRICYDLPRLHFAETNPLTTKPVRTIQDEYYRRTGKQINGFLCALAYFNTIRKKEDIIDAEEEQENLAEDLRQPENHLQIEDPETFEEEIIGEYNVDEYGNHDAVICGFSINGADIRDTALSAAPLHNTALSGAPLHDTALSAATHHDTALSGAPHHDAGTSGATLHNTALSAAPHHDAGTSGAPLHDTALSAAPLHGAGTCGSPLHDTATRGSAIHDTATSGSAIHDTALSAAPLHDAGTSGATLYDAGRSGTPNHSAGRSAEQILSVPLRFQIEPRIDRTNCWGFKYQHFRCCKYCCWKPYCQPIQNTNTTEQTTPNGGTHHGK